MKTHSKNSSTAKNTKTTSPKKQKWMKRAEKLEKLLKNYLQDLLRKQVSEWRSQLTRDKRTATLTKREKKALSQKHPEPIHLPRRRKPEADMKTLRKVQRIRTGVNKAQRFKRRWTT